MNENLMTPALLSYRPSCPQCPVSYQSGQLPKTEAVVMSHIDDYVQKLFYLSQLVVKLKKGGVSECNGWLSGDKAYSMMLKRWPTKVYT